MVKKRNTRMGGYVALMSVIIISVMLLVVTISAGNIGWSTRMAILGIEAKEASAAAAHGCAEYALAHILVDPLYSGNATTSLEGYLCYVFPLSPPVQTNSLIIIRVRASVQHSYTTLEVHYDVNDIHIASVPIVRPVGALDLRATFVRSLELY